MRVLLAGWGVPFVPLLQGYGALPALGPLRETFSVPTPAGETAVRHAAASSPPYIGSLEHPISFGLDFAGWLEGAEALSSLSVTVRAFPLEPDVVPYDATGTLLQAAQAQGSVAMATLHGATAQTTYVLTVSVQTTHNRTLECRMPRIWCPD